MTTGVYQIWLGDYYYFGSAEDCEKRCCKDHFVNLKRGKHSNKKMQYAYDKHQTFSWEVVEDCDDRGMAYAVEQRYIDANFGRQHCLNLNADAVKPPSSKGKKLGPLSEETRRNISEAMKGKSGPWAGKKRGPQTEDHKRRLSESLTGLHRPKFECSHCLGWFAANIIARFHGDKCKEKK